MPRVHVPEPHLGDPWWYHRRPSAPPVMLAGSVVCDAVVVGGGVAGLHAALRLSTEGADVVLVESAVCGGGMSGRSSGFLTPDSELQLHQLVGRYGAPDAARLWRTSHAGAGLLVAAARDYAIACDLQAVDCLYVGIGNGGVAAIAAEVAARREVGFDVVPFDEASLATIHPGGYPAGLTYGGTWAVDAFAYCQGLRDALVARGVRVYEDSPVLAVEGGTVRTESGTVRAPHAVVCLNRMPAALNARASERVYHAQTVLTVSEPLSPEQVTALFPERRFQVWDTDTVYSYYRLTGDHRLLLGGGSAASTFARCRLSSPRVVNAVIRRFRERFPALAELRFLRWWPGLIDVTRDLMPVVDADPADPSTRYVMGCAGIPLAAWSGDHAARQILDPQTEDFSRFFGWSRNALVAPAIQAVLGKPLSFAVDILGARRPG